MEKIIIYIEDDTVSAFNVIKGEPIRPKGLDSMKLNSAESVSDFCEILRNKFNIDDFSEIDMSIYLVNEGANPEILTALREELQSVHNFYENTEENTIELTKKNDETIETLKEEVNNLKNQNDSLESEKKSLQQKISEYETELISLRELKESVTKKVEEKLTKVNEVREKREFEKKLIKADFIHDSQWDINNRYFPRADTDIVYFHKKLNDGDYVKSNGSTIIGKYNDVNGDDKWSPNGAKLITCNNMSGRIYYFAEENETITHGTPIAIIGDFNSIEEAKSYAKEHYLI